MNKSKVVVLLAFASTAIFCLDGVSVAQTPVTPKSDFQLWHDTQLTIPLDKKVDLVFQGTIRLGDNASQPVDNRMGGGFVFKINKYLSFNPFYFHRSARPPNGKHEIEDRLTIGATVRFPIKKFTLIDRNWIERRFRSPQVNATRHRNRVQLEHPFTVNKQKFMFFISDEVFYDWRLKGWVRNRFGIGVSHAFNPHATLDVSYLRQNDGHTRPGDLDVVWTALRLKL